MSAVAALEPETSIVAVVESNPLLVLTDQQKFSEFYEAIKRETDALDADVATEKGRKAIASMAYKVARTKTAIDEAGKRLNEEARARINAVDESRRAIRQQLDTLKDEVRKPLTEWEEAEERRQQGAAQELSAIHNMQRVDFEDTASEVQERLDSLNAMTIDPALHGAGAELAENARQAAIATLTDAHVRLVREEQERAELERLRADQAAREAREREEAEARAAEERRAAEEKAEQDRIAQLQREAEERAKAEAERAAQEERDRIQREHEEALAVERRRAEEAERAAQAERERIAREESAAKAEAERQAAEQRAREADRAHRGTIMGAAKEAIMEAGPASEEIARAIVLAIAAGSVPHVTIRF